MPGARRRRLDLGEPEIRRAAWRSREVAATLPSGPVTESSPSSGFSVTSMTRSGAPFHGAHGEGRSAISPAASQTDAEPCACAFPAARARRNAPVISDNAGVAAPMNWRAESTGNPLPLSRSATQSAENHGKSRSAVRISAALLPWNWKLAQTRLAA